MQKMRLKVFIKLAENIITFASKGAAYIGAALIFTMGLLMMVDVVLRYIFNNPTQFITTLVGYLMVGVAFLGLAYTLMNNRHIRINILTSRLCPVALKRLELITSTIGLVFLAFSLRSACLVVYESYIYKSIDLTGLNLQLYVPQLIIPIGIVLILLQLVVITAKNFRSLWRTKSSKNN
jgi:TRAP-type transport system small permease protein